MGFFIALAIALIFGGCTTFNENENGLRRSCKSGVIEYDDGTTSFKCRRDTESNNTETEANTGKTNFIPPDNDLRQKHGSP